MNCIDADCKYVYCKYEKGSTDFTDIVSVHCKLGQKPSYLFIDDGKTNMPCPLYAERRKINGKKKVQKPEV